VSDASVACFVSDHSIEQGRAELLAQHPVLSYLLNLLFDDIALSARQSALQCLYHLAESSECYSSFQNMYIDDIISEEEGIKVLLSYPSLLPALAASLAKGPISEKKEVARLLGQLSSIGLCNPY
jgi:hypothetical protein